MAFNVSSLTDYTAKATEILRAGILFNDNFSEFDIQTGIQYKQYLNFLDASPVLQAGTCGLTPSGSTEITEKEIEVTHIRVNDRYCFDDIRKKALNQDQVEQTLTSDIVDKIAQQVEVDMWQGDATLGMDGWYDFITVSGSGTVSLDETGATTTTSVDDQVIDLINARPDALIARGEQVIYVPIATYNLYKQNRLAANYYRDQDADMGKFEMWVFGYEGEIKIKGVPGLTGVDDMILTWPKNLVMGTDEISEVSSAKWVVDEVTDFVHFKANFKIGAQVKYNSEVVVLRELV